MTTPPAILALSGWGYALFTQRRGIRILRTSPFGHSPKFAKNNALNGTKFIANTSPLATVVALADVAGLTGLAPSSPLQGERRDGHASDRQMAW
jgi:hypothetical protein